MQLCRAGSLTQQQTHNLPLEKQESNFTELIKRSFSFEFYLVPQVTTNNEFHLTTKKQKQKLNKLAVAYLKQQQTKIETKVDIITFLFRAVICLFIWARSLFKSTHPKIPSSSQNDEHRCHYFIYIHVLIICA